MNKFVKSLLVGLIVLVLIFVIGGVIFPSKWSVTKSITINAEKDDVYEEVANLKNWQNWSPWTLEKDLTQKYTYEGPEEGKGAKWNWTSEKMGNGYLEITDADEEWGMIYALFIDMKGNQSHINGSVKYAETDEGLNVVWVDEGDSGNNLLKKWITTLFIKSMLGKEMEDGLAKLKKIVEASDNE